MTSAVVEHGSEAGDEGDETKIDTVVYRQPSRRLAPGALHREATAPMRDARSVHARVTRCACYLERGGTTRATPVAPRTRRFRRDLHSPKRIARHGQRLALWVGCPMTEWRAWAHSRGLPSLYCSHLAVVAAQSADSHVASPGADLAFPASAQMWQVPAQIWAHTRRSMSVKTAKFLRTMRATMNSSGSTRRADSKCGGFKPCFAASVQVEAAWVLGVR